LPSRTAVGANSSLTLGRVVFVWRALVAARRGAALARRVVGLDVACLTIAVSLSEGWLQPCAAAVA
jgi:hypothetical protein